MGDKIITDEHEAIFVQLMDRAKAYDEAMATVEGLKDELDRQSQNHYEALEVERAINARIKRDCEKRLEEKLEHQRQLNESAIAAHLRAERELCAQVAEGMSSSLNDYIDTYYEVAAAIRARGRR